MTTYWMPVEIWGNVANSIDTSNQHTLSDIDEHILKVYGIRFTGNERPEEDDVYLEYIVEDTRLFTEFLLRWS